MSNPFDFNPHEVPLPEEPPVEPPPSEEYEPSDEPDCEPDYEPDYIPSDEGARMDRYESQFDGPDY